MGPYHFRTGAPPGYHTNMNSRRPFRRITPPAPKPPVPPHATRNLPERSKQEAWGNRTFTEHTPPDGVTAQELCAVLTANKSANYSYPNFTVEGDVVIEEYYYSIGD